MKTFLLKNKKPIIKWGMLPDNTFYEGELPLGFNLAVSPSEGYVVIDIDNHGDISGFDNIPKNLEDELYNKHFSYLTKNNGTHIWVKYSGNKVLANKTSGQGIDLRTNKGYVVWYLKKDVRSCMELVEESSPELNEWLETLFSYKD